MNYYIPTGGRWPANLIHDGGEEVEATIPKEKLRFFYCAKASKKDRDDGLVGGEAEQYGHDGIAKNSHPTVKPSELMQYLCRLITPPGGIVFDPFMGSGSTGKAALRGGFKFIGIEMDRKYFDIAVQRIKGEETLFDCAGV